MTITSDFHARPGSNLWIPAARRKPGGESRLGVVDLATELLWSNGEEKASENGEFLASKHVQPWWFKPSKTGGLTRPCYRRQKDRQSIGGRYIEIFSHSQSTGALVPVIGIPLAEDCGEEDPWRVVWLLRIKFVNFLMFSDESTFLLLFAFCKSKVKGQQMEMDCHTISF